MRNAEVSVAGSNLTTVTGTGGTFRLPNVPAGPEEIVVSYAGYTDIRSPAVVTSGQTTVLDLELTPATAGAAMEDGTEGNVGEFLKYLPGIEMEYVEADTRGPRLGGLNPEYTGVSVDGMKSASADGFMQYGGTENGSTGGGSRSFSFEQVSINSIESIEISRVTPPNLDADAPAGTINMKTKRAFDRRGRLIRWAASAGFNSEEFTINRTPGPGDDGRSRKFKPTVSFSFADSFLDNRLGILLGYSNSNLYNEQYRVQHAYQHTPSAADPRPQVLTEIVYKDGPKWTNRTTYTGTVDFKANENLMFGLNLIFNDYEAKFWNRNVGFRASANNTNVQFEATRPDPLSSEWTIVQTGGADWAGLANYKNPAISDDVRNVTDEINIAALDFTYNMHVRSTPVILRWGAQVREQTTNYGANYMFGVRGQF